MFWDLKLLRQKFYIEPVMPQPGAKVRGNRCWLHGLIAWVSESDSDEPVRQYSHCVHAMPVSTAPSLAS
jgi:hypothetical protein